MSAVGIGRLVRIAHRGASGHAPENSVAACVRAVAMGADFVELDVRRTADGVIFAFHDDILDRTTSGTGAVGDRSLAELRALDAGSWFNRAHPEAADPGFAGLRIATLDELVGAVAGRAGLYIEAKAADGQPGIEGDLVARLAEHGLVGGDGLVLQAFAPDSLRCYRRLAPTTPRVQLLDYAADGAGAVHECRGLLPPPERVTAADLAWIARYADGVGPNFDAGGREIIDARFIAAAHAAGLFVHVWTVDDPGAMQRLIAAGVDGLFTNYPDRMAQLPA